MAFKNDVDPSDQDMNKFVEQYQAFVSPVSANMGLKEIQKFQPDTDIPVDDDATEYQYKVVSVPTVSITMSEEMFQRLLRYQEGFLIDQRFREERLREKYPALKSAYEQYQIVLALVSDHGEVK